MFTSFKMLSKQNAIKRSIRCYKMYNVKSTSEILKQKQKDLLESLATTIGNRTSLTVDEWKEFLLKAKTQRISAGNSTIFIAIKSLDIRQDPLKIAESFIEAFNIERNVIVNQMFIDLYAAKAAKEKLTQSEEEELIKLCNELMENGMFKMGEISGSVFNGYLATKEWKRILQVPKMYAARQPLKALIDKAIMENETELVLKLIESTARNLYGLLPETIENCLNFLVKQQISSLENVEKILLILQKSKKIIFEPVAEALVNALNQSKCEFKRIEIDSSGKCPNCEKSLIDSSITDEEFRLLKEHFESEILHGKQDYHKLKSEDWTGLMKFIKKRGPFDVIFDGSNVALGSLCDDWRIQAKLLDFRRVDLDELSHCVEQMNKDGKRVLIIGKNGLRRIGMRKLESISSNVFLINNLRSDDILLLYAAMLCGPNTYILTNDRMRDHKAEMSEKCRALFGKWQQQRTLAYNFSASYECNKILPSHFESYCHQSDGHWHVPFIGNEERNQIKWPYLAKHWICLRQPTTKLTEHEITNVNSN